VSIGEAIADARQDAGLTVAEVSDKAHVRETIITCVEDDDYETCGGDSYARGYIRIIARTVGADPEPLIREYNTTIAEDKSEPVTLRQRLRLSWVAVLVLLWLGIAVYDLRGGLPHTTSAAPSAQSYSVTHHHAAAARHAVARPVPTLKTAVPSAVPAYQLTPVSAAAFGPSGAAQGDAPQLAPLAIDGSSATAWHTDWYATALFGGLYEGTGLLLDMGRPATITGAQITLGPARGASFQLRVGTAPLMADLLAVANAATTGGPVQLQLAKPAYGRYVLIWFTSLPADQAGHYQVSVYDIRLEGKA
jgi:hypothetical protein